MSFENVLVVHRLARLHALKNQIVGTWLEPEMSGADLARATKLASGTLCPILLRLEQAHWVEGHWETNDLRELGRPRRRLYRITGVGDRKAKAAMKDMFLPLKELKSTLQGVGDVVDFS